MPETAQISSSTFLLIGVVATGLKLLLLPAYHSTDFEVHRNWLAITGTLPVSQWYLEETSEWTLDYPPFFAWFECLLAQGAPLFDRRMLAISATPYASHATVAYQRLTVIATDALLFVGARRLVLAEGGGQGGRPAGGAAAALALCCLDAGLLLVDHVHFQYNG
jgi:alpha-1,3-glucosyltransferase